MKRTLLVCTALLFGCFISSCGEVTTKNNKMEAEVKNNDKVLRHVVIFKFKEAASEEEVQKISDSFNALPNHISVIQSFEWGLNDSPEDLHQGFTHCYMLTFNSEEERDSIYTPHPKHQAFVANLQPHLEKVFVVDYWTK
ncbi:MAG: hypothetical protein ACJART_000399 [Maribacter sp.]|jgi:hypothetical protein